MCKFRNFYLYLNFFWGRGDQKRSWCLVNWETLTTPTKVGGLGIRDTRLVNVALLGKLVWSLLHDQDKLWVQVLTHKYIPLSLWQCQNRGAPSIIWRSILKAIDTLRNGFQMRLNLGNTSFWYSDWTGLGPLCNWVDFVHISDIPSFKLIKFGLMVNGISASLQPFSLNRLKLL